MDTNHGVSRLIGVYHADGGPVGEVKYVIGKLLGTAHCALCDITHSPVRRKPAWDQMVDRLGIPFQLVHLNEMPADVAELTRATGTPVVLGQCSDGVLTPLLGPDQLELQGGSVQRFEAALVSRLEQTSSPCAVRS